MPQRDQQHFLPDFCSGQMLLTLALILEMVAILLCLAGVTANSQAWNSLILMSLFLQWIGLCSAAVLCTLRKMLHSPTMAVQAGVAFTCLQVVVWVIAETAWWLSSYFSIEPLYSIPQVEFLLRSLGVSMIVSALVLRYFWVMHQWRMQITAQGESRYRMLQARMRPHFLFNTLNSIVALAQDHPDLEAAILDLAALLRANLADGDKPVKLADEIELTRAYLRIEQRRLGNRLTVNWQLGELPESLRVPALTLQPLVENAIRHGISPRKQGGCIHIGAHAQDNGVVFEISNPVSGNEADTRGSGEALFNLGERLQLRYPNAGTLLQTRMTQASDGPVFNARLFLPANH